MLKGAAVPRLSHILRSVQKSQHSRGWMQEMNGAHLISAWLHCLNASEDLEHAFGPEGMSKLSDLLELPPSYGGAGLQSPEDSADEEFMGSFAAIPASSTHNFLQENGAASLHTYRKSSKRARRPGGMHLLSDSRRSEGCNDQDCITEGTSLCGGNRGATDLVRGTRTVEVSGRFDPDKQGSAPEHINL